MKSWVEYLLLSDNNCTRSSSDLMWKQMVSPQARILKQRCRGYDARLLFFIQNSSSLDNSSNNKQHIMSPRLSVLAACCRPIFIPASFAGFLLPLMLARNASILSALSDNPGAYNKRIRRGRGPSSGKGKTSGRGHKGQKQHGKVPARFQGGQTPQEIVHGERGFENRCVILFESKANTRLKSLSVTVY
jgi:hypothetical protein